MKKGLKITLISLGISFILIGGLACWQWRNIEIAWSGLTTSKVQIQEEMEEVKIEVKDALSTYNLEGVRDLTTEEEEKLCKGEMTLEEAVNLMVADRKKAKAKVNVQATVEAASNAEVVEQQVDDIVAEHVAKMYTLKAKYTALLANVESQAKSSFLSLPKEEQNLKGLQKIGGTFISEAMSLESQCNSEVGDVLSELEQKLNDLGADTSIVNTMRKSYESEKALRKAYYLSALH